MTATRVSRAHLPGTHDNTTDLTVHQAKQHGQRREWYLPAPHNNDSAH